MSDDLFVWISRWEEFQHYKPERDRAPAWIKTYPAQLDDERYLHLTDHQRAVLHDLRMAFAKARGRLSKDTRLLSNKLSLRVTMPTLQALNDAGFIEFCSRDDLEPRLEKLYSLSRRSKEVEGEKEVEEPLKGSSLPSTVVRPPAHANGDGSRLDGAALAETEDEDNPGLTFDEWIAAKVKP